MVDGIVWAVQGLLQYDCSRRRLAPKLQLCPACALPPFALVRVFGNRGEGLARETRSPMSFTVVFCLFFVLCLRDSGTVAQGMTMVHALNCVMREEFLSM